MHSPMEINQISEADVRARALELLSVDDATARGLPQLASAVTNELLHRAFLVIWKLDRQVLGDWSKQRALAKLVASLSGCRIPSWADAERPGQRMHEFVTRYQERRRKALQAEKKAESRARGRAAGIACEISELAAEESAEQLRANTNARTSRIELEEALFVCRYACTPTVVPAIRLPPGLGPRKVEHTTTSAIEDNLALVRHNAELKRLETEAVKMLETKLQQSAMDLLSSVSTEHGALLAMERERKRALAVESENDIRYTIAANLKQAKQQKKDLERTLKSKEGELVVLGGKVAQAHFELSRKIEENFQHHHKLRKSLDDEKQRALTTEEMKIELEQKLKEKCKEIDMQCQKYESLQFRLGSHVTRVTMELASLQRSFEHEKAMLIREKARTQLNLEKALCDVERIWRYAHTLRVRS